MIRRECMQCSVTNNSCPCHDLVAFSDPADAHQKTSGIRSSVETVTDSHRHVVKRTVSRQNVRTFWSFPGIKRRDPSTLTPLPKDSLIFPDWTNDYKSDPMVKEVFENHSSKNAHKDGIFFEYLLDAGKLWMEGKLCMPDALATRVFNWWQKRESPHSHGRRLWSMIKHKLFGSRPYSHCMKVAAGCAQCAVAVPPSSKKHGHLRPHLSYS